MEEAVNKRFLISAENTEKNSKIDMLGTSNDDWEDGGGEDEGLLSLSINIQSILEEEKKKRRKFQQMRAQHYSMKTVLNHAREVC